MTVAVIGAGASGMMAALTAETGAEAPASLRELDKLEVRFKTVLQPADIRTAALR
jgi:predicted flavoprotein YhiN